MSTQPGKDTIYIDIDDEITAIIDKVRGSHEKIVALVLPKRATAFQSIVNMKLLKRTADEAKKHLVLITSEAGLLPLAGSVGIYVAKTLQSKPEIPAGLGSSHDNNDDQEESVSMADDLDATAPVAEHMRHAPASVVHPGSLADDDDAIELDNTTPSPSIPPSMVGPHDSANSKKSKKAGGKFKIPDFNKFRIWGTIAGVAVVVLVFMLWICLGVLPHANISVKTDSMTIDESLNLRLSSSASQVDVASGTVPVQSQETQKTVTQQGEATGQKDKGTKASGSVTMSAGQCSATPPPDVVAGSGVSINNLTFITQGTTSFSPKISGGKCTWVANGPTAIVAQNNGANYNTSGGNYTVAGRSDVSAAGTGTSGGTSNIVKVVTQADIDGVKQKITTQDTAAIKKELQQALVGKNLYAIEDSFTNQDPEVITNVNADDEASAVTVTQKTTYSMLGARQDDLKKVIADAVNKKIDKTKQQILDYGLDQANFKVGGAQGSTVSATMAVTAVTGTDIDTEAIKKQIAGKKSNDAKQIIKQYPGVTDVTVSYSPFWVSAIPKKTSKINLTIEKPSSTDAKH